MSDNAAVWVVDEAHQREAKDSQDRFRALMPDVDVLNMPPGSAGRGWYARYIDALLVTLDLSYKRFVFFDSDTWLCAAIGDVYDVLRVYPLVGVHAPARATCPTPYPLPDAFPELNTGVLGYTNGGETRRLFERWLKVMIEHYDTIGDNDQGSLRVALWECGTPIWIMPPEYNCRFGFGGFAGSPVKVLHGRGYPFDVAERLVNYTAGMRAWTNADLHQMS